jgi:hypothetical protein
VWENAAENTVFVRGGTNAAFRFNGSKTMFYVPMRSENTFYGLFTAEKMFSCRQQENIVFS